MKIGLTAGDLERRTAAADRDPLDRRHANDAGSGRGTQYAADLIVGTGGRRGCDGRLVRLVGTSRVLKNRRMLKTAAAPARPAAAAAGGLDEQAMLDLDASAGIGNARLGSTRSTNDATSRRMYSRLVLVYGPGNVFLGRQAPTVRASDGRQRDRVNLAQGINIDQAWSRPALYAGRARAAA